MNNYRNNITKNNIALNNTIRQLLTEMNNLNSLPRVVNTAFVPPEKPPQGDAPEGPGKEHANPMPGTELKKTDGTIVVWEGQKWVEKKAWESGGRIIFTGRKNADGTWESVSYDKWDGFTYDSNGHIKRWKRGKK
jgi:hypothetical protein